MTLHVLPDADTAKHVTSYECSCLPRRDVVEHEGSLRWAVVHSSLTTKDQ